MDCGTRPPASTLFSGLWWGHHGVKHIIGQLSTWWWLLELVRCPPRGTWQTIAPRLALSRPGPTAQCLFFWIFTPHICYKILLSKTPEISFLMIIGGKVCLNFSGSIWDGFVESFEDKTGLKIKKTSTVIVAKLRGKETFKNEWEVTKACGNLRPGPL